MAATFSMPVVHMSNHFSASSVFRTGHIEVRIDSPPHHLDVVGLGIDLRGPSGLASDLCFLNGRFSCHNLAGNHTPVLLYHPPSARPAPLRNPRRDLRDNDLECKPRVSSTIS